MLTQLNATPTLAVKNLEKSRGFYEQKLGLYPLEGNDYFQLYKCGNGVLEIYESQFAGSNQATALTFEVGNSIENEVTELKAKGIDFEHYDMPAMHLEGDLHVMDGGQRAAWFKDPDGNILCLHDHWKS